MNALDALHSSMRLSILMISLMMTTSLQAAQQVSLGVRGAAVPYLVSPAGDASGMNGMGASIQTNIPGSEVDSSDTSVGISLDRSGNRYIQPLACRPLSGDTRSVLGFL